jgi:starch synthase (maltosyl-transferring)
MTPVAGERLLRFVGDRVQFILRDENNRHVRDGWRALLRTNLGRATELRREIISAHAGGAVHAGASSRDLPMQKTDVGWQIELPLAEVGYFKAKAYLLDVKGWQYWPDGADVGISVHPNFARTANTIYCAFTRLFGATKKLAFTHDEKLEAQIKPLDGKDFAVIPPSGKLRDLARQLPHIVQRLGCRVLHLLPVHPTPTTFARFGRFGSPYAAIDLTAIDPALFEFDKRTTGVDQFCELTYAAHSLDARIFIDIVINHTGWGSVLQENHSEFFLRNPDGTFASPGAWGTTWEDLVELEHCDVALWDKIADALLIWCRRGVDGFRCDAGYKIPVSAWQYIIARVQNEFPEAIFLLEGLGGSWEITENLLTNGGMQWVYSELFQNYSGQDVANYLDYANRQSSRVGTYVHYSETHDNSRLAEKGRVWSLLRNRLCALTSLNGGFGFTCGVEWLAEEKIKVHGCTGLNWDSSDSIVSELAQLNQIISDHPCFFDGAKLTRLSAPVSPVYALLRESAEGKDSVLVLVNTNENKEQTIKLDTGIWTKLGNPTIDLIAPENAWPSDKFPQLEKGGGDWLLITLQPGAAHCVSAHEKPIGLSGAAYRCARAQAAWAIAGLSKIIPTETMNEPDWRWLAGQVERSPANFLAAASEFVARNSTVSLTELLRDGEQQKVFPRVVIWTLLDSRRTMLVPPGHWLLIEDNASFRVVLKTPGQSQPVQSIAVRDSHVACFAPCETAADAELILERYAATSQHVSGMVRFLPPEPQTQNPEPQTLNDGLVLLTNGIGGMARICVDLGRVNSKYDCILGANLNPNVPVDRHVFVKRLRVWVNADGFLSPLNLKNLASFKAGPPAVWQFIANAGDGRTVEIELRAEMLEEKNTTIFQFRRPTEKGASGKQLPANADVRLTVRFDIEDRNFHSETKRNGGADYHFSANTHTLDKQNGFAFTPATDRQLRVFADGCEYHPQPEWCENIPHPVERSRGQVGSGDAYSPGWFEMPLPKGANITLVVTADANDPSRSELERANHKLQLKGADNDFGQQLKCATHAFVVRRNQGKTVIAGYPWFLDWGRDSLICARGLLAAGMTDEVKQLLLTFARLEKDGTLPNTIHGDDVSNRDTSDAPLWFAVACEELAQLQPNFYSITVDSSKRTIREVLQSIVTNYISGTPNGICMDVDSALIWSPTHFTWMDTNHPAATPREGYPVEIQALWIRLLRQLERNGARDEHKKWCELADRANASLEKLFWFEEHGYYADLLIAKNSRPATEAKADNALRGNCLFAVSLGLVTDKRAKRCVEAAQKNLVVPGALRSLAPLPVSIPLPFYGNDGQLLNDPNNPYWPRYEGNEDTRRKPAYHNGTAWTWTFPVFCEALVRAWNFSPVAVAAAKAYLGSMETILNEGCLGQVPEILDGDAPHTQRGCDAQAWGVTEALRVWKLLNSQGTQAK